MRITHHPHWPLALALLSLTTALGTTNKDSHRNCYYPNGIQSSGSPCFPNSPISPCCGPGFICLSNGLCQPGPDTRRPYQYTVYRSSCTDRTWNASDCPRICLGVDDNLDAGQGLATCGTGANYCCGRGFDCCSNASLIFAYGAAAADIVTTIPYNAASTSSSTPSSSSSSPNALAIGIGVGVGVGGFAFLLAAILAFLLFRRRRRDRQQTLGGGGGGSELPAPSSPKEEGLRGANIALPPPPTYRSESPPVSGYPGGGGMVPGAPLNPAEVPAGVGRERFELESPVQGRRTGKGGEGVREEGGRRHEMEA